MKTSLALVVALSAMGCGGSQKAADYPPPTASTPSTSQGTSSARSTVVAPMPARADEFPSATTAADRNRSSASTGDSASPVVPASAPDAPTSTAERTTPPMGPAPTGGGPRQPDNTAVNERDRGGNTLTPMDQGGSESDRKITQSIRQAVVGDKSLSFTAKNVKIITVGGKVTLRGPVKTEAEKANIEAAAKRVSSQVDNQLEVKK